MAILRGSAGLVLVLCFTGQAASLQAQPASEAAGASSRPGPDWTAIDLETDLAALRARVDDGARDGQLSAETADRLVAEIGRIRSVAEQDRDRRGALTPADRADLAARMEGVSREIHEARAATIPPPPPPPEFAHPSAPRTSFPPASPEGAPVAEGPPPEVGPPPTAPPPDGGPPAEAQSEGRAASAPAGTTDPLRIAPQAAAPSPPPAASVTEADRPSGSTPTPRLRDGPPPGEAPRLAPGRGAAAVGAGWPLRERLAYLSGRIDEGLDEELITAAEAQRGRGEIDAIRQEAQRLVERDGGALSPEDLSYLLHRIDELNDTLRWRGPNPPPPWAS